MHPTIARMTCNPKFQWHPFPEITHGFWCLVSAVDFLVDFFGDFSLGKQAGKNPPKNPKVSRKLFDQNPLRENSALRNCLKRAQANCLKFLEKGPLRYTKNAGRCTPRVVGWASRLQRWARNNIHDKHVNNDDHINDLQLLCINCAGWMMEEACFLEEGKRPSPPTLSALVRKYQRGQNYYKKTLHKENVLAQLIL